ncbi:MAG TPA: hypothetical protein VKB76_15700 [Ktedonobacterales bacterium]|nr:hypothetical protein [Ktedonobacterales bacterium]
MPKVAQHLLLALGIFALIVLVTEIGLSVAATQHGAVPARVDTAQAGPYSLKVSLYTDPAHAGFALPFAIAPQPGTSTALTYTVTSVPGPGMKATQIHGSVTPDPQVKGGVQGTVEITVQGQWYLSIVVEGPSGEGALDYPVTATAPPPIPLWLGWLIGFIPIYGIVAFLIIQRNANYSRATAGVVQ